MERKTNKKLNFDKIMSIKTNIKAGDHDHIGQFNFIVELSGVTVGRFKAVDGLDSETEVIE